MRGRLLLVGLVLALSAPAPAVAGVVEPCSAKQCAVRYRAAPGEANRLTVSAHAATGSRSADVVFHEETLGVQPGKGCTKVDAQTVACPEVASFVVLLGDGDDTVDLHALGGPVIGQLFGLADPGFFVNEYRVAVSGGPGDDV